MSPLSASMRSLRNTTKITRQTCSHLLLRTHWQEQSTKWKNLSMTSKKMVQIHFWKSTITDGFTGLFQNKYLSFIILHWLLHFLLLIMSFCKLAFVTSKTILLEIFQSQKLCKAQRNSNGSFLSTCMNMLLHSVVQKYPFYMLWNPFMLYS